MSLFDVEPFESLRAESPGVIHLRYSPSQPGDVSLSFHTTGEIAVSGVSFALSDGTTLASRSQRTDEHGLFVDLGWLETPVVVSVSIVASVPVIEGRGMLYVVGKEQVEIPVRVVGEPRFVSARSRLRLLSESVCAGQWCDGEIALVNDGTATARDVEVEITLPKWVTAKSGGSWREVASDGIRSLVVPFGTIEVGQRAVRVLSIGLASAIANGVDLEFAVRANTREATFDLDPAWLTVASSSKLSFSGRLVEEGAYRYADGVAALLTVRNDGTDLARGVRVVVDAASIRWIGNVDVDGRLTVDMGDVPPHTDTSRLIEGVFLGTPAGREPFKVSLTGIAGNREYPVSGLALQGVGRSRVRATLDVGVADDEQAHPVRLALRNTGDGIAPAVSVRWRGEDDVFAVVDSLLVDGKKRYGLTGRLPIEGDGLDLGSMPICSTRVIEWRVRAAVAKTVALVADLVVDGDVDLVQSAPVELVCGIRDEALPASVSEHDVSALVAELIDADRADAAPVTPDVVTPTVSPAATIAAPPAEASLAVASAAPIEGAVVDDETVLAAEGVADDEQVAEEEAPAEEPGVRFAVTDRTRARWMAWFAGEPAADVELGRYVLAAREFLPVSAGGDMEAQFEKIRTECDAIVTGRLMTFKSTGIFGAAGYDFSTGSLRLAVGAIWASLDQPRDDLRGAGLDHAIIGLTAARGTAVEAEYATFRDALLDELDSVESIETYGAPASAAVHAAAVALFEAIRSGLPVAA